MVQRPARQRWRKRAGLIGLLASILLGTGPAIADPAPSAAATLELQRAGSIEEYARIQAAMSVSQERLAELEAEIESVREDEAALAAALIQAAKTERKLGQDIEDIAARLEGLRHQQGRVRGSLMERRAVLAEVLAALQRMGLNPPPAMLVRADDALASVRSAILLGAVVPEMRAQTLELVADLRELDSLSASIEAERGRLFRTVGEQEAERARLAGLIEEKKRQQLASQAALDDERRRSAELASEAGSLEELIASLESEIETVRDAAEAAQREAEKARERAAANRAPMQDMMASLPFSALKGQVALPVAGHIAAGFGSPDGAGRKAMGDMVKTHSGAIVTAPAGGAVLYAGPFRSYGQLLILNAGDGYHIVLAGMGSISVGLGQTVMAGEPVGAMGEARLASAAAFDSDGDDPELYVEFRKDGKPVDPSPWWAERSSGRIGNDT